MSISKVVKASVTIGGLAVGIALSNRILGAYAAPTLNPSAASLAESGPDGFGTIIWVSKVTPKIFGADATDFDYHVMPETVLATESVATYASAMASGTEDEILTAFLNTTMAGTMTPEQSIDLAWKCGELSGNMVYLVDICSNVGTAADVQKRSSGLQERSRFKWIKSAGHIASTAAVNILYGALGNALYASFPSSPRSWCNNANGATACLSWSNVESFEQNYARTMVSDALSAVDFNQYSAQANNILGSRKRSAADVCISNRADGCT